jgi:hypothetical protein
MSGTSSSAFSVGGDSGVSGDSVGLASLRGTGVASDMHRLRCMTPLEQGLLEVSLAEVRGAGPLSGANRLTEGSAGRELQWAQLVVRSSSR